MEAKKVIIIGAGIAGLSAGCYLRMNGYDTEIFEMHSLPGGLCTSWKRKGYIFDGCIHWLTGSAPGHPFYQIWTELHALHGRTIVNPASFITIYAKSNQTFTVYTDAGALEREMLKIAPEDAGLVHEFAREMRKAAAIKLPVTPEQSSFAGILRSIPSFIRFFGLLSKWARVRITEYARRYQNPLLRETLRCVFPQEHAAGSSVFSLLFGILAPMHSRQAGYPLGGSLEFARAIELYYRQLGGKICYGTRVEKILAENGCVQGVTAGGARHDARIVISAADGHATFFQMLEGRYLNKNVRSMYSTLKTFSSQIQVSLGVARDCTDLPEVSSVFLKRPLVLEGGKLIVERFISKFYRDKSLAPEGKTSAAVLIHTYNADYWQELRSTSPDAYARQKDMLADAVIEELEAHFGNIRRHVEIVDVATPATYVRYTGNWKGSIQGWLTNRDSYRARFSAALPGLDGFYHIGQWESSTGGLPPCARMARDVACLICKNDGRKFRVSEGVYPAD